jgi:hypothetical protein
LPTPPPFVIVVIRLGLLLRIARLKLRPSVIGHLPLLNETFSAP